MNRKAFLLGFSAIGGQTLLLRELISSLNGDEIFIGSALFGWLIAVALGAYWGGKPRIRIVPALLFTAAAVLLPLSVIAVRLAPLLVTETVGEIVPFTVAASLSIILMLPTGIVSGALFPAITRQGIFAAESVVQVYLFEGIGAFVGGAVLTVLVGSLLSTLGMALLVSVIIVAGITLYPERRVSIPAVLLIIGLLVAIRYAVPAIDTSLDEAKYESFRVLKSFDTHYSHEAILERDSSVILLTDNTVEASEPDVLTDENLLIPPLLYHPATGTVLFVGRAEFGVAQLARKIPGIQLDALDPRTRLNGILRKVIDSLPDFTRIDDDPVSFARTSTANFDIIVIDPGEPDNYRNSRLLTPNFLRQLRNLLSDSGIVVYPSSYDTDRYISPEKANVLSVIYNTFAASYDTVVVWPGDLTIFFGFVNPQFAVPADSVIARANRFPYKPTYLSESQLMDRLGEFRVQRLNSSLGSVARGNTINQPVLPHYQVVYRSPAQSIERKMFASLFERSTWLAVLPLAILVLFVILITGKNRSRRFSLFLYFTAGAVSLSLELVSFYVYQSLAGSLYSELAILIGAFMLGLAIGTFYAYKISNPALAFPALILMAIASLLFLVTYDIVAARMLLVYHLMFQFTVALATGTLFVAATSTYYPIGADVNRGAGYAAELLGSSLGALTVTTLLLPAIGLQWVLIAITGLTVLAIIGAIMSSVTREIV